jgi:NADH-quinone oxidoreductase subunit L
MLAIIILAPLAGAAILGLFGKRMGERLIGYIACSTVLVSAVFSFIAFFQNLHALESGQRITQYLFTWINVGNFRADFALLLDPLSAIYILFITFVAFWIHVFATGYMKGEDGYWRFFAYLNLFMFSMLTLILGNNFLLMFVGWEGVGLCSYLLIGFYFKKGFASDAAKKAFIFNRVGDFGFALGVMLLFLKSGSIFYFSDSARGIRGAFDWAMTQATEPFSASMIFAGGLTTIGVLLFVGATGKSAQIPLFVWLPDAMAGPTPVSALIHAATMVTAGVYMIARASSIYVHAPTALAIVAIIGAATAIFAATIGIAQSDIKKVLAYSTVSQLGYMFLACGVGAFTGGIFHVFTHAFFKALLFLGSGSVIIGMHHEQDMRKMGGLKKYMPITFWTMFAGYLAIAGIPPLSGFFSKDEILYRTFTTDAFGASFLPKLLWVVGALTALLTAVYMTRMMVMTFGGKERFNDKAHPADAHDDHHSDHDNHDSHDGHHGGTPHETPKVMTTPLIVLAICATLVGFLGMPAAFGVKNYFEHFLEPSIAHVTAHAGTSEHQPVISAEGSHGETAPPARTETTAPSSSPGAGESHSTEWILMIVSVVIAIAGILIGKSWFSKTPLWQPPQLLEDKYKVDEAYDAVIIQPIKKGSASILWKIIDVKIIDGLVNAAGAMAKELGSVMRYLQSGLARSYVAFVVFGALLIIGYFILRIR